MSPGVATTGGAGLGAGGARAGGRMPSWFCSTSRRMSSGSAARNEGSTPSGRLIPKMGGEGGEDVLGTPPLLYRDPPHRAVWGWEGDVPMGVPNGDMRWGDMGTERGEWDLRGGGG